MSDFDDLTRNLPEYTLPADARHRHQAAIARLQDQAPGRVAASRGARRRRIGVVTASVVGLAVVGGGVAAAITALTAPPTDRGSAYCFTTLDVERPITGFGIATADGGGGDAAKSAAAVCGKRWGTGEFRLDVGTINQDADPNGPATHPVPDLIVCVLPSGAAGVFPGTEKTCGDLGLPVMAP